LLGKFIGFHNYRGRIAAEYDGFQDTTTEGKRPNGAYIPRFRNVYKQETDFLRGYAAQMGSSREPVREGWGSELKDNLTKKLGPWQINASMVGEVIPRETNFVRLDSELKDKYGLPQMRFSVEFSENELKMLKDFHDQFAEMLDNAGFKNIQKIDTQRVPGHANHEMGGVRMGKDPKTSMLNAHNQLHACKNVFVTDGACMTSTSTQNPSLTYMALTARAVDWAVREMK
jgi:choline dehydrogenase-like flavoprotein